MILGNVNANREAIIQIAIVGNNRQLRSIGAVIDTGFTGDLTLPKAIIEEMGFTIQGIQEAILGDGSFHNFEVYDGVTIWDGQMKRVEINATEMTDSLIGMGLLEDYKLEIEGRPGGEVRIISLSAL